MGRHIGIVGVSAEGAALCYRTICVEGGQHLGVQGHPEVTMHTYSFTEYMEHIRAGRWAEVGRVMLASADILLGAGADLLICPDNTVHQAFDHVEPPPGVGWIHIAEAVAEAAQQRGYRRLGILGTRYLMEGPVYPSKLEPLGIEWAIPQADRRGGINEVIFTELVYGRFEDRARHYFHGVINELRADGCDAVVLGCTEIPLLVHEAGSPLPTLDSTRILARAALREAARAEPVSRSGAP
ncbi:MAG: aspartate/glutamate racemase family protein [Planctomycetota bacterium]|jgi:aspartate racemase